MQDQQNQSDNPLHQLDLFEGSAIHSPEPLFKPVKKKPKPKPKPAPAPPPVPAKKKSSRKGKPIKVKKTSIEALNRNRPQEILLTIQHCINGMNYGPGVVRVPGQIADLLREQEQRSHQIEREFNDRRAFIIGPRGRKRQVAYDTFDLEYGGAAPIPLGHF